MGTGDEIDPAVRSILDAARERSGGDEPVDVDARSLPEAFAAAEADGRVPIIAEVKPTSPTTDGERADDPVELAREMVDGGAAALSVLTEPEHFGGSTDALARIREAVDVPVLRKDFLVREAQLDAVEADVVLLIVRFLDEPGTDDLADLLEAARDRGFQVLVETHSAAEVERALDAGAEIVGVNNRDLAKLDVHLGTFEAVAPAARDLADDRDQGGETEDHRDGDEHRDGEGGSVTLIAESGIATTTDVERMREAGADALLIGSAIMDGDVGSNTRRFATATTTDADATETDTPAETETETAGDTQ